MEKPQHPKREPKPGQPDQSSLSLDSALPTTREAPAAMIDETEPAARRTITRVIQGLGLPPREDKSSAPPILIKRKRRFAGPISLGR